MADTQLERIMRNLKCTQAEAEAILAEDKVIDRGGRTSFDLDPQAEKQAKKYANAGTRTTKSEKSARKAPENPTKEGVITAISNFLTENGYQSVEITNKTRQIAFKIGEDAYEITLIAKRKPKSQEKPLNRAVFSHFWNENVEFCAICTKNQPPADIRPGRNSAK